MAVRSRLPVGSLCAVVILTVLLCVGFIYLYLGWAPFTGSSVPNLTVEGYVGMVLGLIAAILLGTGLVMLVMNARHKR